MCPLHGLSTRPTEYKATLVCHTQLPRPRLCAACDLLDLCHSNFPCLGLPCLREANLAFGTAGAETQARGSRHLRSRQALTTHVASWVDGT
jgi:hypothetical protein